MIETPSGFRQVSVAEAAVLLGVSVDTIKRRVRSGALQSSRTVQGRVLVSLPESEAAPHAQGTDPELGGLLERMTAVTAERDWLRERVERAESEREQLRILLSNAQQSLVRALQAAPQTAPQQPVEAPTAPEPPAPATDAPAPRWRRWRAWLVAGLLAAVVASASCQASASTKHAGLCTRAHASMDAVGTPERGVMTLENWPNVNSLVDVAGKTC
jgi:excisionase family DNA binding protein